jgi:hypothetical protein
LSNTSASVNGFSGALIVHSQGFVEGDNPRASGQLRSRVHDISFGTAGAPPTGPRQFDGKEGDGARSDFFPGCFSSMQHGSGMRDRVLDQLGCAFRSECFDRSRERSSDSGRDFCT